MKSLVRWFEVGAGSVEVAVLGCGFMDVGRGVIGEIMDVGEVVVVGWEDRRGCGEEAVVPLGLRIQVELGESVVFRRGLLKCEAALPKV